MKNGFSDNYIGSENQCRYRRPEIDQKISIAHKVFQKPCAQYPTQGENNPGGLKGIYRDNRANQADDGEPYHQVLGNYTALLEKTEDGAEYQPSHQSHNDFFDAFIEFFHPYIPNIIIFRLYYADNE